MVLHWSLKWTPLILMAIFGIATTIIILDQESKSINQRIEVEFTRESNNFIRSLDNSLNTIRGIEETFHSRFVLNNNFTLEEFDFIADDLENKMVQLRAVGVAP
jgi:hypothetical protein